MDLRECISQIIGNFASGTYFDSHTIINELVSKMEYHSIYLKEYATVYSNCTIAQYHGQIALLIPKVSTANIAPIGNANCMSHTIYGDIVANQLWQKQ